MQIRVHSWLAGLAPFKSEQPEPYEKILLERWCHGYDQPGKQVFILPIRKR